MLPLRFKNQNTEKKRKAGVCCLIPRRNPKHNFPRRTSENSTNDKIQRNLQRMEKINGFGDIYGVTKMPRPLLPTISRYRKWSHRRPLSSKRLLFINPHPSPPAKISVCIRRPSLLSFPCLIDWWSIAKSFNLLRALRFLLNSPLMVIYSQKSYLVLCSLLCLRE